MAPHDVDGLAELRQRVRVRSPRMRLPPLSRTFVLLAAMRWTSSRKPARGRTGVCRRDRRDRCRTRVPVVISTLFETGGIAAALSIAAALPQFARLAAGTRATRRTMGWMTRRPWVATAGLLERLLVESCWSRTAGCTPGRPGSAARDQPDAGTRPFPRRLSGPSSRPDEPACVRAGLHWLLATSARQAAVLARGDRARGRATRWSWRDLTAPMRSRASSCGRGEPAHVSRCCPDIRWAIAALHGIARCRGRPGRNLLT
jgi:hypothetical protein